MSYPILTHRRLFLALLGGGLSLAATDALAQVHPPYVEFMGARYILTRSDIDSFQGIAIDPATGHVYSEGIFERCGDVVDDQFASDAGMAWDPVNDEIWMLNTATRNVYRFDAGGDAEVIFTIPPTFDVPGVGPSVCESPQGLALDETHVYVVDAGENIGELAGNEWFKFTREGTPVSSSAVTDFVASIDAPVDDAIADGIVWVPPTSPVAPGLFLVAFEHTGIMVIDEDGFFVDDITWEEAGLVYGTDVPFAFADITIDPATGDLYLVENDGSGVPCHVWVRVPDDEPVLLGSVSLVHGPDTGCPRRLLNTSPASGLVFGLAYRPDDGLVWGTNFSSGDIVKIDPRSGREVELVPSTWGQNYWGITYDTERDDFYLHSEIDDLVRVITDPDAPSPMPLPNPVGLDFGGQDLAFNPDDGFIYAVGVVGGSRSLVRIDRDSGIGTPIAPSERITGLTFDAETGQLFGIGSGAALGDIFAIDPVTGDQTLIATTPHTFGWEGLLALRGPSDTTPVAGTPSVASVTTLRAHPNPFGAHTTIGFELDVPDAVRIAAYDVAGRLVRRLDPVGSAGRYEAEWDGRSDRGRDVPAGMYFLRLEGVGVRSEAHKVFVVR